MELDVLWTLLPLWIALCCARNPVCTLCASHMGRALRSPRIILSWFWDALPTLFTHLGLMVLAPVDKFCLSYLLVHFFRSRFFHSLCCRRDCSFASFCYSHDLVLSFAISFHSYLSDSFRWIALATSLTGCIFLFSLWFRTFHLCQAHSFGQLVLFSSARIYRCSLRIAAAPPNIMVYRLFAGPPRICIPSSAGFNNAP